MHTTPSTRTRRFHATIGVLALASLGLTAAACGSDEADAEITDAPAATAAPTTVPTSEHAGHDTMPTTPEAPATTEAPASTVEVTDPPAATPEVVEVHAANYGFGGIPAEVPAGTSFSFVNDSTDEVHEFVAVRLPDTETRSVHEIVQAADFGALFGAGEPAVVVVAGPNGGEPWVAVGDGSIDEPGRYAVVCFIPTGADPEEYFAKAAESTGGPVQVDGGPPHVMNGMYAEVVVTP